MSSHPAGDRLRFEEVTFRYERRAAAVITGLTWDVPAGRTALLGPNGAGKTTLLRLGASSLGPASGRVSYGTLDPSLRRQRGAFRRSVGWMPQEIRPLPGLSVREQVAYVGWLKGMSRAAAWSAAARSLAAVGLDEKVDTDSDRLSGGQLRRLGLAQTLVHSPSVLLLDEPSVGLDPAQRAGFRRLIQSLPGDVPVLVSTHQVDDLSDLFDHVAVLAGGRLVWQGDVASFLSMAPVGAERTAEAAYAAVNLGA
jgi:ABC-2 type transport system ATP-binding protein